MAGWLDYLSNTKSLYVKKALFEVLKERYQQNEPIIERLSLMLVTETDVQAFFKLITDTYEAGYMKSVADHSDQLKKIGVTARVVPSQQP